MTENYEFSKEQNDLIKALAFRMQVVSIFFCLTGVVVGLTLLFIKLDLIHFYNVEFHVMGEVFAAFLVISGLAGIKASTAFKRIVTTQGSDIDNLMHALKELYRSFDMQFMMIIISALLLVAVTVFIREV